MRIFQKNTKHRSKVAKVNIELMLEAVMQWKVLPVCYSKASNRKFTFENLTLSRNYIFILVIEQRS